MPYIIAAYLYSQHWQLFFYGCHRYTTNIIMHDVVRPIRDTLHISYLFPPQFVAIYGNLPFLPSSIKSTEFCQVLPGLLPELPWDRSLLQSTVICRLCYTLPSPLNPIKFCQNYYPNYCISYSLLTQPLTYICRVFVLINIFNTLFRFPFVITSAGLFWLLIY
jgi:hypothetical protein